MNPTRSIVAPDPSGPPPSSAITASTPPRDEQEQGSSPSSLANRRRRKPWLSSILMAVRRMHLYFGILLMPWALVYGISGYLFNHPTHFQESSLRAFGSDAVQGTPLAQGLDANATAARVVETLNQRFGSHGAIELDPASAPRYEGDFLFASGETTSQNVQLLLHRDGSGGTLRITAKPDSPKPGARFDIQVGETNPGGRDRGQGRGSSGTRPNDKIEDETTNATNSETEPSRIPIHASNIDLDTLQASVITIAERLDPQLAAVPFKVTSLPELVMQLKDGESTWNCRYNSVKGSLASQPLSAIEKPLPSWRRFLTRLHTTHGYPLSINARWVWAIIVDIMAFVMVFWGISGLIMWWQIKRTRPLGTAALVISLTIAVAVGSGMLQSLR